MCFRQRHLKRLLAFSTISHVGMILAGLGTGAARGVAGAALYVLGHGLVKGGLFICTGILLHRLKSVDELELHGRGRSLRLAGFLCALGGLGLAGFPPFGTYLGKGLMEEAADRLGYSWLAWVFTLVSAVTGAAVLRVAGRIFLGWGPKEEGRETVGDARRRRAAGNPLCRRVPAGAHASGDARLSRRARVVAGALRTAAAFGRLGAGRSGTLHRPRGLSGGGARRPADRPGDAGGTRPRDAESLVFGFLPALAAIGLAALALFPERLPRGLRHATGRTLHPALSKLEKIHSGHVGDYAAWLTAGVALLGALLVLVWRAG